MNTPDPPPPLTIVHQVLTVEPWPLTAPGQWAQFGVIVAMGAFPPGCVTSIPFLDKLEPFADFALGSTYRRFKLPDDGGLRKLLAECLAVTMSASKDRETPIWKQPDTMLFLELTEAGHRRMVSTIKIPTQD